MHPQSTHPLEVTELHRLDGFLSSDARGTQAMSLSYAHGFMTSIASGPETLESDEWLRLMFDEPVFENAEDGSEMLSIAVRLYAEIERGLSGDMIFRPVLDMVRNSPSADTYADAQRWCLGYTEGLRLFSEHWTATAKSTLVMPLEVLFQLAAMKGLPNSDYQQLCDALPDTARAIYDYWKNTRH